LEEEAAAAVDVHTDRSHNSNEDAVQGEKQTQHLELERRKTVGSSDGASEAWSTGKLHNTDHEELQWHHIHTGLRTEASGYDTAWRHVAVSTGREVADDLDCDPLCISSLAASWSSS